MCFCTFVVFKVKKSNPYFTCHFGIFIFELYVHMKQILSYVIEIGGEKRPKDGDVGQSEDQFLSFLTILLIQCCDLEQDIYTRTSQILS